jgi:hypothetical protein
MADAILDIAFWIYDRTRALVDGSVRIEGVDAHFHSGRIVTSIFKEMIRRRAYDVSELGMTYLLRTVQSDEPPFLAIPVFPVRSFRHSAIYVNRASGIQRPEDLEPARPSASSPSTATMPGSCPRASCPMNSASAPISAAGLSAASTSP